MPFNCKISNNITSDCSTKINGGIRKQVYLYNIDDVQNLVYEDDKRVDNSLIVDTIVTDSDYYYIDAQGVNYSESEDDGIFTHTLTVTLAGISTEYESYLTDLLDNRFLVAFKVNSDEDYYKLFGWEKGADVTYSSYAADDGVYFTITFEDESEYPLLGCNSDNFFLANKFYTPFYSIVFGDSFCEVDSSDYPTGYTIVKCVYKTNYAGEYLDESNQLCSETDKSICVYVLEGYESEYADYNILGTYSLYAYFNGDSVYYYDSSCLNDSSYLIVTPSKLWINGNVSSDSITITVSSSSFWYYTINTSGLSPDIINGYAGVTETVWTLEKYGSADGTGIIRFVNTEGLAETITITIYAIVVSDYYTIAPTSSLAVTPTIYGGSMSYTVEITSGSDYISSYYISDGTLYIIPESSITESVSATFMFYHSDNSEVYKEITVYIIPVSTENPVWVVDSQYCEVDDDGINTGYITTTYIDINYSSSSYGSTYSDTYEDVDTCPVGTDAEWTFMYSYCEYEGNDLTGNLITVYKDTNSQSSTYNTYKYENTESDDCLPDGSTDADWEVDEETDAYCEETTYGITTGNSGYNIITYIDTNTNSDTYAETKEEKEYDTETCPLPDVNPSLSEQYTQCHSVTYTDSYNNEINNYDGTVDTYYIDTNEYSSTYGEYIIINSEGTDSDECEASTNAPEWVVTSETCQTNVFGTNTGIKEVTHIDTNTDSPTYGKIETILLLDETSCPVGEESIYYTVTFNISSELIGNQTSYTVLGGSDLSVVISGDYPDSLSANGTYGSFEYDNTTGIITITDIQSDITVTSDYFTVTLNIGNGTSETITVEYGEDVTYTITPDEGYVYPLSLIVSTYTGYDSFDYDSATGIITITNLQTSLTVIGTCIISTYTVTMNVTGLYLAGDGTQEIEYNSDYYNTIRPDDESKYALPDSITIEGTYDYYTYDSSIGEIFVYGIQSDITITAAAVQTYFNVYSNLTNCSTTITEDTLYAIGASFEPYTFIITSGYQLLEENISVEGSCDSWEFDGTDELYIYNVQSDITITAEATASRLSYTTYYVCIVVENGSSDSDIITLPEGNNATFTVTPDDNYYISSITMYNEDGDILDMEYTVSDNVVTIYSVEANTTVIVTCEAITYMISLNLTNTSFISTSGTYSDNIITYISGSELTAYFEANSGYSLPETITLMNDTDTYEVNNSYTWDSSTGLFTLDSSIATQNYILNITSE